ncbi:MAG: gas vesicle protein [Thermoanaerobaculia bacterium]
MNQDRDLSLVEALDHLLDRGVVIAGEAVISVGQVDLVYLGLNIILSNVDTISRIGSGEPAALPKPRGE